MGRSVSFPNDAVVAFDHFEADEDIPSEFDWQFYVEALQHEAQVVWPSMSECDDFIGREDRAIMENDLAWFGVSEYCGCVAIWLKAKDEPHYGNDWPLAHHWVSQAGKTLSKRFGTMDRIGVMSNGEAVYQKR